MFDVISPVFTWRSVFGVGRSTFDASAAPLQLFNASTL
jgi:hypothetical protein